MTQSELLESLNIKLKLLEDQINNDIKQNPKSKMKLIKRPKDRSGDIWIRTNQEGTHFEIYSSNWKGSLFPACAIQYENDPIKWKKHLIRCEKQYKSRIFRQELYQSMKFDRESIKIHEYEYLE